MRSLAVVLLLASTAGADVKVIYQAKGIAKGEAAMRAAVAKHVDELGAAANGKAFEIHFGLHVEGKTDTTCRVTADVGEKGTIFASLTGGATLNGTGEKPVGFCADAVIGDLIKSKIVPLIEKKAQ